MELQWMMLLLTIFLLNQASGHNKYAKSANQKPANKNNSEPPSLKTLQKPFMMLKVNNVWSKAVLRLSEPKLKSLFSELKIYDKNESAFKRVKSEGGDKDGMKEAELRKTLLGIMDRYGIREHFEYVGEDYKRDKDSAFNEASDDHINKSLFKDKKLNKLWSKAESAGFTTQELLTLKEEFNHHQDKIDEYYSLLKDVKEGPDGQEENSVDEKLERYNTLYPEEPQTKDFVGRVNQLRDMHHDLRDGIDRLNRLAAKGPNSKEFVEPKVQGLWKIAVDTNFTAAELESLRTELLHYENRLLKLRHYQVEAALYEQKHPDKETDKTNGALLMKDHIKKQTRKVEKIHLDLETRIMQKHIEL